MDIDEPYFQLIAGQSIDATRPAFTHDSRQLLVPTGRTVRVYSTKTGQLDKILGEQSLQDHIISVQQHPTNHDLIVIFTFNGFLDVWDVKNGSCVVSTSILDEGCPIKEVAFARLFEYNDGSSKRATTFAYFTLNVPSKSYQHLYFKKVDLGSTTQDGSYPKKMKGNGKSGSNRIKLFQNYGSGKLKVSFSPTGDFVVVAQNKQMCGVRLPPIEPGPNHLSENSFTCLVTHPKNEVVATGNEMGQVIVWSKFIDERNPIKSLYHWHSKPVADIYFSPSGTRFYSGGQEAVVVCWENGVTGKQFIPRIGAPIKYLVTDRHHKLLSVTKTDNTIDVISTDFNDFSKKLISVAEIIKPCSKNLQLFHLPQTDSLVMHGRPGHLQIFSLDLNKQVEHLDVVGRNLFPEDDASKMSNPEVWSYYISPNGVWLVTDDGRDDGINLREERLKFWRFDEKKNTFVVVSIINNPHDKKINSINFSPNSELVITTSDDGTFKLWSFDRNTKSWRSQCQTYSNKQWVPSKACFSSDSSIIAVLFKNMITFYGIGNDGLEPRDIHLYRDTDFNAEVTGMSFGFGDHTHQFVEVRGHSVRIWDIFDQETIWVYDNSAPLGNLVIDQDTNQMACYSKDKHLIYFNFDQINEPEKVLLQTIGAGKDWSTVLMYLPRQGRRIKSHLILFTSNHELISVGKLEHIQSTNPEDKLEEGQIHLFGRPIYPDSGRVPIIVHKKVIPRFNVDRLVDDLFLKSPSHTLASIDQLCSSFMKCLASGTAVYDDDE